jgi:hypothetical protein
MPNALLQRTHSLTAPAPPGSRRPARFDRPPDGWIRVRTTRRQSLAGRIDLPVVVAADKVARTVSRRHILRRVGQWSLMVGLAGTRSLWGPSVARADVYRCNRFETDPPGLQGACGPSPLCRDIHCAPNAQHNCDCDLSANNVRQRTWDDNTCTDATTTNCWQEECCDVNGHVWRCCDCCEASPATNRECESCPSPTRYMCICRCHAEIDNC